jgi:alpha-1,2-mannosyltransferase
VLGHRWAPWALGLGLSLLAAIQALHRARQGRVALLKWEPDFIAFWSNAPLYGRGTEGYPTLPLSLLVMSPFRALGEIPGACAWALFKIGLAWWIVTRALKLASEAERPLTSVAQVAVILFAFRPLASDIQHGNLNLLVGAAVASAAWAWHRGRPLGAGFWLGMGAVLKVTPALGLLFFAWKRSGRGLAGMGLGAIVGLFLPALWIGWERNLELDLSWWDQMIAPYLSGRELTLLQTEHINQSLFGVLARLTSDSVAIPAATTGTGDLAVNLFSLSVPVFRTLHLAISIATLAFLLACLAPRTDRRGPVILAEFSLLALAMLQLSERSWKHHYVLIAFPIAFLISQLGSGRTLSARIALAGLVLSTLLIGGTGSAFLGDHGSNLAEAYGSFLVGGLALYVATGVLLRRWVRDRPLGPDST